FTYVDVLRITNNFERVLQFSGYGTFRAINSFKHRNLTSLIGYYNEGIYLTFICEYTANRDLGSHLLGSIL
ncbi:Protein kinase-like domain containing protein, partial [Trema orientale]